MAKYTGLVNIFNSETGDTVFERTLTFDEIVDHFIAERPRLLGGTTGKGVIVTLKNVGQIMKSVVEKKTVGKKSAAPPHNEMRERVIKWHAKGWTNSQIAQKVGITPQAVGKHVLKAGLTPNKKGLHGADTEDTEPEVAKVQEPKEPEYVAEEKSELVSLHDKKALSLEEYLDLREAMSGHDFMSSSYALTHKLSPREVNKAIRHENYDAYIEDFS